MSSRLLVVDLCGTIVRVNTTHGFLTHKQMPIWRRMIASLLLSRPVSALLHCVHDGWQRSLLIGCLRGMSAQRLRNAASAYAVATLTRYPREEVLASIKSRQAAGSSRIFLASASIDVVVEAFAEALKADGFVATELGYADGNCTGRIVSDATACKLKKLQEYLEDEALPFDVITDNVEDSDLMQAAENVWFIHAED